MLSRLINERLTRNGIMLLMCGIILQVVVFFIARDSVISLCSGIAGVCSVVLCSERKISMYIFGFIQLITYVILCIQQNLYGEIIENGFYFITMIVGIVLWSKNYNDESSTVNSRFLSLQDIVGLIGVSLAVSIFCGWIATFTNDTQPYLDMFSTVPAFIAQILMILRYKEQWYFWLVVDVLTCILWIRAENYCMVVQYIFWTGNCLYGLKRWRNYVKI